MTVQLPDEHLLVVNESIEEYHSTGNPPQETMYRGRRWCSDDTRTCLWLLGFLISGTLVITGGTVAGISCNNLPNDENCWDKSPAFRDGIYTMLTGSACNVLNLCLGCLFCPLEE